MLALTGDMSHTRLFEIARRANKDGRPTVMLYFADFDPSGWCMPVTVARRLQALRDLQFPDLDIEVRRVALTAGRWRNWICHRRHSKRRNDAQTIGR